MPSYVMMGGAEIANTATCAHHSERSQQQLLSLAAFLGRSCSEGSMT